MVNRCIFFKSLKSYTLGLSIVSNISPLKIKYNIIKHTHRKKINETHSFHLHTHSFTNRTTLGCYTCFLKTQVVMFQHSDMWPFAFSQHVSEGCRHLTFGKARCWRRRPWSCGAAIALLVDIDISPKCEVTRPTQSRRRRRGGRWPCGGWRRHPPHGHMAWVCQRGSSRCSRLVVTWRVGHRGDGRSKKTYGRSRPSRRIFRHVLTDFFLRASLARLLSKRLRLPCVTVLHCGTSKNIFGSFCFCPSNRRRQRSCIYRAPLVPCYSARHCRRWWESGQTGPRCEKIRIKRLLEIVFIYCTKMY